MENDIPKSISYRLSPIKKSIFEPSAYRVPPSSSKQLFFFDESLKRIFDAGYSGHPLPREEFSLIIDGIEGKLSGELFDVQQDMIKSAGEWLDVTWKTEERLEGNLLYCYEEPRGVVRANNGYDFSHRKYSSLVIFGIKNIPLEKWVPIQEIAQKSPELVIYLYSRPLEQLPEFFQNACIMLPGKGIEWPVGRGYHYARFVGGSYAARASRGKKW